MARIAPAILLLLPSIAAAQECAQIVDRAQAAFDAHQFVIANAELESALARCPQDATRVRIALAQTQYLLGKEADAEQSLLGALALDGRNVEALYALGRIYLMQNRYPEAVERLQAVTRIDSANYKAWDNLGVCYDAMNRDADALKAFFKALDLVQKDHPKYDWAHANLADFFLRRNENEKAFQLAAEAATRNPDSARNCFLTGKALVHLGKQDLSVRWLERAVELDPQYADALYLLGQTYRKLGRQADATRTLERFKEAPKSRPHR
ncbi:MAG TPA: tetratricopeptide repeat protein [Bryobacteraceae bacterium]|jgi:tetratricopeptide (TPR) repeat protein